MIAHNSSGDSPRRPADGLAPPLILPLDSSAATLDSCGGKGVNLVRLSRAGFRVPPGFVITTDAYDRFVVANNLPTVLAGVLAGLDPSEPAALEAASTQIRAAFAAGRIPADVVDAVHLAWDRTFSPEMPIAALSPGTAVAAHSPGTAVAVRSSATAEDLPDLSFAGQQDTFLNVIGAPAVLDAVVACWASLWTARAIGYRARNGIPHDGVSLAVVVQELIPSEVSGVLFTANPLTGARDETVIDATWGLGEALVSGQVEPDHFVLDTVSRRVTRTLGAKSVMTSIQAGGGVTTTTRAGEDRVTLTDDQVRELSDLGRSVAELTGTPQDLEWAIADGVIHLLQARAITSLYPIPDGDREAVWFSFGAIQGMLQPMTPLGQDAIATLLSGATQLVGARRNLVDAGYLRPAGERLWIRIDRGLRHPLGGRILPRVFPMLEPSVAQILTTLADDPRWAPASGRLTAASIRGLAKLAATTVPQVPTSLIDPARRRRDFDATVAGIVAEATARQSTAAQLTDPWERLAARARAMRETLTTSFPVLLGTFAPIMGPAMFLLIRLTASAADAGPRARVLGMEILRGLPGNVTTEMDLALWRTAAAIQADPAALDAFIALNAETLTERYATAGLPASAQRAIEEFLAAYGMRGIGEIDLGQPRWRENPIDVVRNLRNYVRITHPEQAPAAVFARGVEAAEAATAELIAVLAPGHSVRSAAKARRIRFIVSRLRTLLGARETPKFTMIQLLGLIREGLLASGRDLVEAGVLERVDDLFFLRLDEIDRLRAGSAESWQAVVTARRQVADRERQRRQVPKLLVGDGRAFYEGVASVDGAITGSPVSPGIVEGPVRVVFDPQTTHLEAGEIMVCPGTDPAWTPLFLSAGGLITEVGGMMTHGSVVAREYGIPAVVGVHQATSRLQTGQRIRLDGMTGSIEILDDSTDAAPRAAS